MKWLDQCEQSKKLFAPIILLAGLSFALAAVADLESLSIIPLKRIYVVNFGLVCVAILIIVFILESLLYFFGKFHLASLVFGFLLSIIRNLILLLTKIWIALLKPFIAPVVRAVLNESELNNKIEYLQSKQVGRRDDDTYFSRIFSTKNISLICKPTGHYPRWRLGIKFSNDDNFPETRFDQTHYLFHLTKDENNDALFYHLYEKSIPTHNYIKLIDKYSDEIVKIKISTGKETNISIYNSLGDLLKSVKTVKFKKMQILAWADGVSNFELEVKVANDKT